MKFERDLIKKGMNWCRNTKSHVLDESWSSQMIKI